jgi:hypothetical protein
MGELNVNAKYERANSLGIVSSPLPIFRFVWSYLFACLAGTITYCLTLFCFAIAESLANATSWGMRDFNAIGLVGLVAFLGSIVCALPYTIAALICFKYALPQTRMVAFSLGILCAVAAEMTLFVPDMGFYRLLSYVQSPDFFYSLGPLIPAGLVATYVFGVFGMGYGFRNWPLKWW